MADFNIAFRHLMGWEDEGNTGRVTTDAGGLTRYGITSNAYPSLDIKSLTLQNAYKIYLQDFWLNKQSNVSEWTSQAAANKFLQLAVNLGIGLARQFGIIAQYFMYDSYDPSHEFKYVPSLKFYFHPTVEDSQYRELIDILGAMQLSRYMKDYHLLHNVPGQLIRRATSVGKELGWKELPSELNQVIV